jgi:hypothetical protein
VFVLKQPSKCIIVQAAKITKLEKQIKALEKDKCDLTKERDLAIKDVEGSCSQNSRNKLVFAS